MLFISHATPEDNEFSRWLALQLAKEGYPVWCDLTKLLGGEPFWKEIEEAIRDRTTKFLFVLSKSSNQKEGALDELSVASTMRKRLKDDHFILPLRIDDLPHGDININLHKLNAIDFSKGWMQGFQLLVKRLTDDGVSKDSRFGVDSVSVWWRNNFNPNEGVSQTKDHYCSNRLSLNSLPPAVTLITLDRKLPEAFDLSTVPFPISSFKNHVLTFAASADLFPILEQSQVGIAHSQILQTADLLDNGLHNFMDRRAARNHIQYLLKQSFQQVCLGKGLQTYALSSGRFYYWFASNLVKDDKIHYSALSGGSTWKAVVGYKTVKARDQSVRIRNWHYGIECLPTVGFETYLTLVPHVAFSENGVIYDSVKKQHAFRRSQCKGWYNNDWRDRLLATIFFLTSGQSELELTLGPNAKARFSSRPLVFESPVTYTRNADALPLTEEVLESNIDADDSLDIEEEEEDA